MELLKVRLKLKSIEFAKVLLAVNLVLLLLHLPPPSLPIDLPDRSEERKVSAAATFSATSGQIITGTSPAATVDNTASYGATFGSDNNYWAVTRVAATPSLDLNLSFANVSLHNANKIIITFEDTNATTATAYVHQICDWTSATGIDNSADTQCNGTGGWRTLHPRRTTYTNTSDTTRNYEIYDGYFWDRTTTPGTVISTPLTNFVNGSSTILMRVYTSVSSTVEYRLDLARVEVAVDPYYEPADYVNSSTSGTTAYINDLIGANSTNLTASDGNKFTMTMSGAGQAIDNYFVFKNVRTYTGANTILVTPEICVSNVALTFSFSLYNFTNSTWTTLGSNIVGSACSTDTEYAYGYNSSTIGGFNLSDHISNTNEVRFRINTNAPGTAYNIQMDRIYILIGSVNDNSSLCEISWGTGTDANCTNTRTVSEGKTATPAASTWQATATIEYDSDYYSLDNDDDATNAEYAASQNLSFPVDPASDMAVTAIHYAVKYRSNSTAQTMDLGIRDYSGLTGTSGWALTPGTDSNALTTYSWFDTWTIAEYITSAENSIDSVNNLMNLRARTSAGTTTNPGTRDWAFAMMSIRWVEESARITLSHIWTPRSGALITGADVATSNSNTGSWRATMGNDSGTNGSGNYWTTARQNPGGLNKQLTFTGVEIANANKLILTVEDSNITTGNAYSHQICDWVSTTGVNNAADSECTGGGWRTINPRLVDYTNTSDTTRTYELYNGYFSDRTTTPGTAYDTPVTNFVNGSNEVLFRVYSTVNSTVQHRLEMAQLEAAIDSVYEPVSVTKINSYAGATSNYISDVFATTASDNNKLTFTNATSNPLDVYFSFNNVRSFTGANTILIKPEICVSNVALTFNIGVYNFNTSSWETINASAITGTACTTDTSYAMAKNNITLSDYLNGSELRVRIHTSTLNTNTLQLDRLYLMIGSTNTDTDECTIT